MKENFDNLRDAMDLVGFSDFEQELLFEMTAGCLTLGNINMSENDQNEVCIDINSPELNFVCVSYKEIKVFSIIHNFLNFIRLS